MTKTRAGLLLTVLLATSSLPARADEQPLIELLLPGGTLCSLTNRSYRSLSLPEGWSVAAASYSPDGHLVALILMGTSAAPKKEEIQTPLLGPVNKAVRLWRTSHERNAPSAKRLVILDRRTGEVTRSWRLTDPGKERDWSLAWTTPSLLSAIVHVVNGLPEAHDSVLSFDVAQNKVLKPQPSTEAPTPARTATACPLGLAETHFRGNRVRFEVEKASCSTPPEPSDTYRLIRENPRTHKEAILWDYRVVTDKTACLEAYACYSGGAVQFLTTSSQLFLSWDADLYAVNETDDGVEVELVTQLLPQYSHPWGIAAGETRLQTLDVANKVAFQPVSHQLAIAHAENPTLYAQNFCPTRSFNAFVEVGPYTQSEMVPAGYQVGPVDIGSFKDRPYTPLLVSVTWTAFHHISEPVFCREPYTVLRSTKGIVVSLAEDERGALHCRITFQEER